MKLVYNFLLSILLLNFNLFSQNNSTSYFKDGDVVCFLGDSITHGGQFHELLQLYYTTRYPSIEISFHNCGISGDSTEGMINRLEEDVLSHNPTHIFLLTGMNDVNRTLYSFEIPSQKTLDRRKKAINLFKKNTEHLSQKILKNDITLIYLTPTIYDQYSKIETKNNYGCNDALIECSNHLNKLAKKRKSIIIDLNKTMKMIMEKGLKTDSLFTIIGKDRVHPEITGNFIIFNEIISTLERPNYISKIEIDLKKNDPIEYTNNCTLNDIYISDDEITFQVYEHSLPFPILNDFKEALLLTTFEENYNQQILKISGLKKGDYDLFIEDIFINRFSAKSLSKGQNISNIISSPQNKQSINIKNLCSKLRKIGYQLRTIPFIDYKYLNDYEGKNDKQSILNHLNYKLNQINTKPYYNYIKNSMNEYIEIFSKEDSLNNDMMLIYDKIQSSNDTKPLFWKIKKRI